MKKLTEVLSKLGREQSDKLFDFENALLEADIPVELVKWLSEQYLEALTDIVILQQQMKQFVEENERYWSALDHIVRNCGQEEECHQVSIKALTGAGGSPHDTTDR